MSRTELARVKKEHRLVELRRGKDWQRQDGYVVGLSKDWCALMMVDCGLPRGLVVMRTKDIRKIRRPNANAILTRATLQRAELWPPHLPELIDLYDIRTLLSTAGSLAPVLAVATEKSAPGVFFAGNVLRIGQRNLLLREIKPNGRWGNDLSWKLRDITRVDLGTPYLENLRGVAGPHPDQHHP